APAPTPGEPPLPDVESLTFDSDFRAFLSPKVEEGTRRAALKKLFSDPRFNVMDGLDVYIDDYNKFEPMTPEILKQLVHARYLFDPPKTRVNAQGHVEDVVDEPVPSVADAGGAGEAPAGDAAQGNAGVAAEPSPSGAPSPAADAAHDGDAPETTQDAAVPAPAAMATSARLPSESAQPLPAAQRPPR
ncbi:MAG TPA: DUF3306 domain-containing protein, partial [Casimicrobiaceae bacterium]|nr:DUF3306 domain-containing protein [Casimicrobiaceae bacterium]